MLLVCDFGPLIGEVVHCSYEELHVKAGALYVHGKFTVSANF